VCSWVRIKVLPQVTGHIQTGNGNEEEEFGKGEVALTGLAINIIRQWGEVFCGFGAYSVQEVVFRAGLCSF